MVHEETLFSGLGLEIIVQKFQRNFQGVFWNRLDEQNLKLTMVSKLDQILTKKNC